MTRSASPKDIGLRELGRIERTLFTLKWLQDPGLIPHIAPLGWNHINLTGDYVWHANKRVAKGRFRPLRATKTTNAKAV